MSGPSNGNLQLIDFGDFSFYVPISWKKTTVQNGDKGKGNIVLDESNKVEFNLGPDVRDISSYRLIKVVHVRITEVRDEDEDDEEDEGEISAESTRRYPTVDNSTSEIFESDVHVDVIDGTEVKILTPQNTGKGAIGFGFARIGVAGNKFNLVGSSLKPENETALLAALRTLKFHNATSSLP